MPPVDRLNVLTDWVPGSMILRNQTRPNLTRIVQQIIDEDTDIDFGSVGATFIGGNGSVIDTGSMGSIECFTARTVLSWEVLFLPGVTNGIVFDVWKTDYANYETVSIANSIFSGAISKPYIIGANKNKSLSMAGVDTTINAGDILVFVCLSRGSPRWSQISLFTQDA